MHCPDRPRAGFSDEPARLEPALGGDVHTGHLDNGMGILMDDRCDLLVYFVDWPREPEVAEVWWSTLEGLIQLNDRMECPVVIAPVFSPMVCLLICGSGWPDAGVVTLQGLDDTLSAFRALARYPVLRAQVLADPESRLLPTPAVHSPLTTLNEAEGKALLAEHGIPVPIYATDTVEEIIAAADLLGYPLAVKLLNADLAHKNQAGAVHLNIKDAAGLDHAISAIQASVTRYDVRLDTSQFLIERMVSAPGLSSSPASATNRGSAMRW